MITLRLLGPVELRVDGAAPPPELLWKKNLALLVYLVRTPRHSRTREHLTGLLWGDKPDSSARHSLNEALRVVRRGIGDAALHTDAAAVRLDPAAVELDLDAFAAHEAAGAWDEAAALVGGVLLEGFAVPAASGFEDWLTAERTQWQHRSIAALVNAADTCLARGRTGEGGVLAQRALVLDPTSGPAVGVQLRALALSGERAAAMAQFAQYTQTLRDRLDLEPDAAVATLAERIGRGRLEPAPESELAVVARTRRLPLFGREPALATLWDAWGRCVHDRETTVAVILADAGLGKTRLIEELSSRVVLDGGATLGVRGIEGDHHSPWSGILGLGRGGLLDAPGIAGAPASAHAAFAAEITEWGDRYRGAAGAAAAPLARAFTELMRVAAEERPVLLSVDDCHLLDVESLESVVSLTRDMPQAPLLLVLTAEPDMPTESLDSLRSHLGRDLPGIVVELDQLGSAAIESMAHAIFPAYNDVSLARLARRVGADSAGVPLLAIELLHAVASGLELQREASEWPAPYHTLTQTSPGDLPDTVIAAVRIGYRRLSEPAQRALAAVAAVGGRLTAEQVGRAAAIPAATLHPALDELEWQRWLVADSRGYGFVARVVERIIERDMLTPGQRRRILAAGAAGAAAHVATPRP